ncbi:MAG: alkaline phosphatase family protein, partial [Bacteroidaceae bacterium]|nr:alkaline phosphatase family protein [Bacteroidaceae bacterium]
MMNNKTLTILALGAACLAQPSNAQQAEVPRLVVNVLIDGLRTDYLQAYAPFFGERGFKRLEQEGK